MQTKDKWYWLSQSMVLEQPLVPCVVPLVPCVVLNITVYGAGLTPLKQNCTYALCVPSFMFSCFSDPTLFQTELN